MPRFVAIERWLRRSGWLVVICLVAILAATPAFAVDSIGDEGVSIGAVAGRSGRRSAGALRPPRIRAVDDLSGRPGRPCPLPAGETAVRRVGCVGPRATASRYAASLPTIVGERGPASPPASAAHRRIAASSPNDRSSSTSLPRWRRLQCLSMFRTRSPPAAVRRPQTAEHRPRARVSRRRWSDLWIAVVVLWGWDARDACWCRSRRRSSSSPSRLRRLRCRVAARPLAGRPAPAGVRRAAGAGPRLCRGVTLFLVRAPGRRGAAAGRGRERGGPRVRSW